MSITATHTHNPHDTKVGGRAHRGERRGDGAPAVVPSAQRCDEFDGQVHEVMGVINAAMGRLVELLAVGIPEGICAGVGLSSPGHWLAWQAGLDPRTAKSLCRLAQRLDELPETATALSEGRLTVDQAAVVAKLVPAEYEASAAELASQSMVSQLRRTLARYSYDHDRATDEAQGDGDADEADRERPKPVTEKRHVAFGTDEHGNWSLHATLPADEGAAVEAALRATRDDLYQQALTESDPDAGPAGPKVRVGLADALVSMAETALSAGHAAHPSSDRFLIYAHLELGPAANPILTTHLGSILPDHLRRLLTCDATLRPVLERDGAPCNVGRDHRVVPRRIRRLIEHRDGGCAVPGCHRRWGLEAHHIVHWEDGGPTNTANLLTLCRTHHRLHHLGQLHITGNADHTGPAATDPVTFRDRHQRLIGPVGTKYGPLQEPDIYAAARRAGITPGRWTPPPGYPHNTKWIHLNPRPPQPETTRAPDTPAEAPPPVPRRCNHTTPGHSTRNITTEPAPTRAGPLTD